MLILLQNPIKFVDNPLYEKYPRCSTPLPERQMKSSPKPTKKEKPDIQYEKFRISLETTKFEFKVRGVNQRIPGLISGQFLMYGCPTSDTDSRQSAYKNFKRWISSKIEVSKFSLRYKPR